MSTEDIQDMLSKMGLTEETEQRTAIAALQEAGVISPRPNRSGIASSKKAKVKQVLHSQFLWHCRRGDCQREATGSGRPLLLVDADFCAAAAHAPRQALLMKLGNALQSRGLSRVLLVGGTGEYWQQIESSSPADLEWRFIDGKKAKDYRHFRPHKCWAQLTVIWASTPLDHKVSQQFVSSPDSWVVTAPGRGIEAMVRDVLEALTKDSRN